MTTALMHLEQIASSSKQIAQAAQRAGQILMAVCIIDIKTRFGSSIFSYLIAIAWPLVHMGFLMVGFLLANRIAPIGDDPTVFAGSGMLPYILCMYPARMMMFAILSNRFLLSIPIVMPIHLLFGRLIVEFISAFIVCIIFYVIILMLGIDFMPIDFYSAAGAIGLSVYLGIGVGVLNALFGALFGPFVMLFFIMLMIGAYMTAGIVIPFNAMSHFFQTIAVYNPIFHCVELLRAAYYIGARGDELSIMYVIYFASICLVLGLAGERLMRGKYM